MSFKLNTFASYLIYLFTSGTRHSVHSPFVYKLIEEVIRDKQGYAAFRKINTVRQSLLKNSQLIEITEFNRNRGSMSMSHQLKSVSTLARESSVNEKYGRLLYRLAAFFKPETVIETGTSLGLSTMYLALANDNAKVFTVDACTIKSEQAAAGFKSLGITNVEQQIGLFDIVLPGLIRKSGKLDFAFIDGDYTCDGTTSIFDTLLKISHNDTVFVIHQIHKSTEMEKAWDRLAGYEQVTVSIDLFGVGIIFLKRELSRQNFVIRF